MLETFFAGLSLKAIDVPTVRTNSGHPGLRDPKDAPIVEDAIRSGCDYLVTEDKDLHVTGSGRSSRTREDKRLRWTLTFG